MSGLRRKRLGFAKRCVSLRLRNLLAVVFWERETYAATGVEDMVPGAGAGLSEALNSSERSDWER